ncbi:MAG: ATP-binding protein, partial [Alphaproteobacteria bacterium]
MSIQSRPAIVRTFMTHEMSDSDIVAVSTGREAEFQRIMGAISRSRAASPGTLQHVVLYGSRGFGKSFMMRRVEIALGQHDHGDGPVRFLLLPEEQHNLQKSPYALLTYITVLLKQQDSDAAFEEAKFQWPKPGEAARRWTEAAEKLEEALDHSLPNGQGLVVVAVENFDTLLATLFAEQEDEQRLREWLFRSGNRLMLLATATGTVDMDYDRPLFQAFETVRLTPWTTEDCITYFNRKRESEGKPPLDAPQEAKARAVAEFIGGTPRLAQLLGEVIETEDALSVSATMDALADRLAEYYRRRIEDLGPLVRGLLDALIRGGEPASQTELAQRVGADGQNQIARAMADLQRADIVRGRSALDSRETLYTVTDRVFAHYYRLRQGSRTARATPLASILDFLRSFYTRDEQRTHGLRYLLDGRVAEGALLSRLAIEGLEPKKNWYINKFETRLSDYLSAAAIDFAEAKAITERLEVEPEQVFKENNINSNDTLVAGAIRTALRAQALYRLGHTYRAVQELEDAAKAGEIDLLTRIVIISELITLSSTVNIKIDQAAEFGVGLLGADLGSLPPLIGSRT